MNIVDTIRNETNSFWEKAAVIDGDRQISYGELFASVDKVAAELKSSGVRPAQRVALICDDNIDYIILSLAVLSLRAGLVPISPAHSRDEINAVMDEIHVNFLVFDKDFFPLHEARPVFLGSLCEREFFLHHRAERDALPAEYYALNPAFIRFSSGTTAASKGVVISHEAIIERTDAANKVLGITANDIVIWVLSMSYHFVVTILLFLRRGATIILCCGAFPASLLEGLSRHRGTFLYASPFHYHMMTNSKLFSPDMLYGVRLAISTAMRLPEAGMRGFNEKFGFELTEAYGIIEVGLPFINCSGASTKHGSVGKILPDYQMKIINPDTEGIGEVYVKGKGMFDAYYSPWQDRQQALLEGWFKTGDLGSLDTDGFLFLAGREKNVINFAGMKIFPQEVESVLNQHPAIRESLVFGTAHDHYGELPCANIVLHDGIIAEDFDQNEIRRFCYKYLSPYKVPKEFHYVPCLERTVSGKLRRWRTEGSRARLTPNE